MTPQTQGILIKTLIAAATAVVVILSGGVHADAFKGQFVIDGKKLDLTHVAAFRLRNQRNAREFKTLVLWTPAALDEKSIAAARNPYTQAVNDPAVNGADYVSLSIQADGKTDVNARVGGTQYLDSSGELFGKAGGLKSSCRANTAKRLDCDVASLKPIKTVNGPVWELRLSFDTAVQSRSAGATLPAGGGDVGKAFLALSGALKTKNKTLLMAHLDAEDAASYQADDYTPEENFKRLLEDFERRLPKQPKITGGESIDAARVLLEVEGVPSANKKMLYHVEMRKVDGAWRYVTSDTLGALK